MLTYWIALNAIKGLGPTRINALVGHYKTPKAAFEAPREELETIDGISADISARFQDASLLEFAEKQIELAASLGVKILSLDDTGYPLLLKEIFAPPPVIYTKGDISTFNMDTIGIVGTRHPTTYGKSVASKLSSDLCAQNIAIASGMASGIDTSAHKACIENKGKTIAVLGCGVDIVYPKENRDLAEKIPDHGIIVSEFPLGTMPETYNFPRRNRIISGLSSGIVVIEAGEKSGALITSSYALAQSRDVFAVPGSIFSPVSVGPFNLICQGAIPIRSAQDIIAVLRPQTPKLKLPVDCLPLTQTLFFSDAEKQIMKHLNSKPMPVATLTELCGLPQSELFCLLLTLELRSAIRQLPGQNYVAI